MVELTIVGQALTRPVFWVTIAKWAVVVVIGWLMYELFQTNSAIHKMEQDQDVARERKAPLGEAHDAAMARARKRRQTVFVGFALAFAVLFLLQLLCHPLF